MDLWIATTNGKSTMQKNNFHDPRPNKQEEPPNPTIVLLQTSQSKIIGANGANKIQPIQPRYLMNDL